MSRLAYALADCDNENCNQSTQPLSFKDCGTIILDADITSLFIAAADFDTSSFDPSDLTNWTANIDNSTAGKIMHFTRFEGGVPRASRPSETIVGVKKYDPFPFQLEGEIVDVNATNHESLQKMQACPSQYKIWYETGENELLWGGDTGILCDLMFELSGARGSYLSYFVLANWEHANMPSFIASPFS